MAGWGRGRSYTNTQTPPTDQPVLKQQQAIGEHRLQHISPGGVSAFSRRPGRRGLTLRGLAVGEFRFVRGHAGPGLGLQVNAVHILQNTAKLSLLPLIPADRVSLSLEPSPRRVWKCVTNALTFGLKSQTAQIFDFNQHFAIMVDKLHQFYSFMVVVGPQAATQRLKEIHWPAALWETQC